MISGEAISVSGVHYSYGQRQALCGLSLAVCVGDIFAIVGPNGSGKSSLFRLLSTLMPMQLGDVSVLGWDLRHQAGAVRASIGVVFQQTSLDAKLSVLENLRIQSVANGLSLRDTFRREGELVSYFGLTGRAGEPVGNLSGGMRRRADLARGLIHGPRLLLLDEPTAGLDPVARDELWSLLRGLRDAWGITIVFTSHLLDEAEGADRLAVLDGGIAIATGSPRELRSSMGQDVVIFDSHAPVALAERLRTDLGVETIVLDGALCSSHPETVKMIPVLWERYPELISSVRVGKPTLYDFFAAKTGHLF